MDVNDRGGFRAAQRRASELIDAGDASGAIAFVDGLVAGVGHERNVRILRAVTRTHTASLHKNVPLLRETVSLWRALDPGDHADIAFNLANAQLAVLELTVQASRGWVAAWDSVREYLHEARAAFERIGRSATSPLELRLKSWTNAGNTYDIVGRDLEAIECYGKALALDGNFAMALGNRGSALFQVAKLMGSHRPTVLNQARVDLDAALAHGDSVRANGVESSLADFQSLRDRFPAGPPPPPRVRPPHRWPDPYLRWADQNELFLHVSHACLAPETRILDPLLLKSVTADSSLISIPQLLDAFNACKQDYLTARYVTWLAFEQASPLISHAQSLSGRASFADSGTGAQWDAFAGLAVQAFAATANVLDKVANYLHLYIGSRRTRLYFKTIASPAAQRGHPKPALYPELGLCLDAPEWNRGVMALVDLSHELQRDTTLSRFLGMRHAATHRFMVVHIASAPASDRWIVRSRWDDLRSETLALLRAVRAALVYLARAVGVHEARGPQSTLVPET